MGAVGGGGTGRDGQRLSRTPPLLARPSSLRAILPQNWGELGVPAPNFPALGGSWESELQVVCGRGST